MDIWTLYSALAKFGLYLGALGSAGLMINAVLFRSQITPQAVSRATFVFAMLGLVSAVASFTGRGAALLGEWSGAVDPEILLILWETPVGTALMLRVIGFAVILIALLFGTRGLWPACVGGILVLSSFTQIGHVTDAAVLWLPIMLLLHLIVAAFWFGILIPLRRLAKDQTRLQTAAALGHGFGQIALWAIPVLILAGGFMTYELVGSVSGMFTPYGALLLAKLMGVAGLLGLGAVNKLRFVPKMQAGGAAAAQHLARSLLLEGIAFTLILACTAFLTSGVTVPQ